jgi:tagatose-6-phosphate ketose/aldose isomerase
MPSSPQAASWLATLAKHQPDLHELVEAPAEEHQRRGYDYTLAEICQQPSTWLSTCELMIASGRQIAQAISGIKSLVLTGSGSSEFAGACIRLPLQTDLGITTEAIGSGAFLTLGTQILPPSRPGLLVSLSRSGDSPESLGTVSMLLEALPELRHLILTCNGEGSLARIYRNDPRVTLIALDPRTNDRSLVMTSSFTNLVLAARSLGYLQNPDAYRTICQTLSRIADQLLRSSFGAFADLARRNFGRVVFLGSGNRLGSAREAALKMLEMTAGHVSTMYETYLGLRHGPMSFVSKDTLVVCFLSCNPRRRAYEFDLLRELDRKRLGLAKVVVGENIPRDLLNERDVAIDCEGLSHAGDDNAPVIDVMAAQLLAFFRCLEEELQPDSPSANGVISRVVESFTLHEQPRNGS